MNSATSLVNFKVTNRLGQVIINRPEALNATNLDMVELILAQLLAWQNDDSIVAVILRATGDKAFCAGGDIRDLYEGHLAGSLRAPDFFRTEYILDQLLHSYSKPVLALGQGLVLGGGMGLFQGASLKVITEQSRLGMPETAIGYFPDVGGSYFLSRLPGELGSYMAVSGVMLDAKDALYAGLADWMLPAERIEQFDTALAQISWSDEPAVDLCRVLIELCTAPEEDPALIKLQPAIDEHFAFDQVEHIIASLAAEERPEYLEFAQQLLATLSSRSPMAMVTALAMQRRGRQLSLEQCFAMEQQAIAQWFEQGDFIEGVRALIVDKDKQPKWKYSSAEEVPVESIEALLQGF